MLTRIRNANLVKARNVTVIKTNLTIKIAEILKKEGFIKSFEEFGPVFLTQNGLVYKYISITLKYKGPKLISFITGIKRVSKPGLRVYSRQRNIPKVLGGIGIAVCPIPFI
jgi:small subunit ribosomal protein S8